jgi:hypothetical protein
MNVYKDLLGNRHIESYINIVIFLYIHDIAFSSIFDHFHDLFHRPALVTFA